MAAVRGYLIEDIGGSALALAESARKYRGCWRVYFAGLQESDDGGVARGAEDGGAAETVGASRDVSNFAEKRLYMELGCGKGKFINTLAQSDPDSLFLGIEGLDAVLVRGLERAAESRIVNLRFIQAYVADIRDYFADSELDGIYLNFSDPWPKPRHEKRRFTYGDTLLRYRQILKPGGFVAFKTDNEELFEFTLTEIERLGLTIEEMSRDLHGPDCTLSAREVTTEYEDKFSGKGKNINYVKIRF